MTSRNHKQAVSSPSTPKQVSSLLLVVQAVENVACPTSSSYHVCYLLPATDNVLSYYSHRGVALRDENESTQRFKFTSKVWVPNMSCSEKFRRPGSPVVPVSERLVDEVDSPSALWRCHLSSWGEGSELVLPTVTRWDCVRCCFVTNVRRSTNRGPDLSQASGLMFNVDLQGFRSLLVDKMDSIYRFGQEGYEDRRWSEIINTVRQVSARTGYATGVDRMVVPIEKCLRLQRPPTGFSLLSTHDLRSISRICEEEERSV